MISSETNSLLQIVTISWKKEIENRSQAHPVPLIIFEEKKRTFSSPLSHHDFAPRDPRYEPPSTVVDFGFIRRGEPVMFRRMHCFRAVVELAGKLGEIYISPRTPVRLRDEDDRGWASLQLTRQAGGHKLRFATMGVRSSLGGAGSEELDRNQVREARAVQLDILARIQAISSEKGYVKSNIFGDEY